MATELSKMGHDVKILYRRETFNVRTIACILHKKFVLNPPPDWVAQFSGEYASYRNLTPELVGDGDVIMAIGPDCVEEMVSLPDNCGCKVFNVHGLTLRDPKLRQAAWEKDIPKIAVSNYVSQEMMQAGVNNIIGVVPNGIDTAEYFPDEGKDSRGCVGAVYAEGFAKDPKTIISVFALLHRVRPEIPLVCFSGSPRPKELIKAVQYHRLPTLAEARRLYSRCLVWFCASRSEGFGLPLLEAMACGCAIVSADCGGPRDYLQPGVNGILVEKESPDKLVREITRVLDDEGLHRRLVDNALKTTRMFTWHSSVTQMEKVLHGIL
jgi:glycosyltransferase involved in cell wall biosynthesis